MHAYSKDPLRLAALAQPSACSAAKAALTGAAAWLGGSWLGKAVSALARERAARLAIDELRSWDDHMLRDIGLERMHIEPAVRGKFRALPAEAEAQRHPPHPYH
jgi:uncharacterized protein YjiS (DUF1127 family)